MSSDHALGAGLRMHGSSPVILANTEYTVVFVTLFECREPATIDLSAHIGSDYAAVHLSTRAAKCCSINM
eukprot:4899368-Pyramimonas_sp.AAC.1